MFPIIFQYKMLTIGGYGIMLGLAFYLSFLLLDREFKLNGIPGDLAYKILLAAIPSAIVGAKLFHIIDYFDDFLKDPVDMIFSGSGLTVYGGYITALLVCMLVIKKSGYKIFEILDLGAPALALGYAIGRIGCHVAGDGCYGIPSDSILGVAYPNGISPVTETVLPTPLFESFASFIIFAVLMELRKKKHHTGFLFSLYLLCNGICRFAVEFIRLNPKILPGLSQAQVIAILFMITGILGLYLCRKAGTKTNPDH